MGVKFFEHLGGEKYYVCNTCANYLTNKDYLVSSRFTSGSGQALLFQKVVNVDHSYPDFRSLVTGSHSVRDVFCKKCAVKLGWFYEFASKSNQMYKEGKTILELSMICEMDNIVYE